MSVTTNQPPARGTWAHFKFLCALMDACRAAAVRAAIILAASLLSGCATQFETARWNDGPVARTRVSHYAAIIGPMKILALIPGSSRAQDGDW